ncbi:MAG: acyloxyacyl hydrolase [Bacteroidota bacterium]
MCSSIACSTVHAQEQIPWSGFGIETNMMAGKILKHSTKFKGPIPPVSTALDINFFQQTYGRKYWHQRRKFPIVGVGITYTNYGNNAVYGYALGLYPSLQLPLITGKNFEWTARAGFGIGYISHHYERAPVWDTLNNAIGSHINNFSLFTTDLRYHVNSHWDIQAGLNFSHISNAALKVPNLGINMYGAHIGLRYFPVNSRPQKILSKSEPLPNRWLVQSRLGIAMNQGGSSGGPMYRSYLASLYASKRWKSKNKVFGGIDYSYHEKVYAFLQNNEIYPGDEAAHSWKSAVFVGNEYLLGRVGIVFQLGVYLHQAYLTVDPYYEKLGGNVYLVQKEKGPLKELFLSVLLKTHKTVAELTEVGIGVGF